MRKEAPKCGHTTPFGSPVEPEVNIRYAGSSTEIGPITFTLFLTIFFLEYLQFPILHMVFHLLYLPLKPLDLIALIISVFLL